MPVFIGCRTEAIPIWVDFAAENVEHDHYVDFVQKYDDSGEFEDDAISFPKLYMEDGTDHLKTSIDWRIQEM